MCFTCRRSVRPANILTSFTRTHPAFRCVSSDATMPRLRILNRTSASDLRFCGGTIQSKFRLPHINKELSISLFQFFLPQLVEFLTPYSRSYELEMLVWMYVNFYAMKGSRFEQKRVSQTACQIFHVIPTSFRRKISICCAVSMATQANKEWESRSLKNDEIQFGFYFLWT